MSDKNIFEEFPPISSQEWRAKVEKDLKGKPFSTLEWEAEEGLNFQPYYRKEDVDSLDFSFHKRTNDWHIQEDIELPMGRGLAATANGLVLAALESGISAPNFILDEVLDDKMLARMLRGVHLNMIYVNFSGLLTESHPEILLRKLNSVREKQGITASKFRAALHVDPIGFYIENGDFYQSQEDDFESLKDAVTFAHKRLPRVEVITAQSHFIHNQGSTIARELAILIAKGTEYLVQLDAMGLAPAITNNHLRFSVSVGNDYFMEIAKIRALRALWRLVLKGFGIENARPNHIHAQTSVVAQQEDSYANMISSTTQAMSAAIAGVDSLTVQPSDIAYDSPTSFSRRIARNVSHLLKQESYFDRVVDPSQGSYYIEKMTEKLADLAWRKFQSVEDIGGLLALVDDGK